MAEVRFEVIYLDIVLNKHIPSLPNPIRVIIKRAIEEKLMTNPLEFGKPLQYSWKGHRRLRVGNYRIIYKIEPKEKIVTIVAIDHRKEIYS